MAQQDDAPRRGQREKVSLLGPGFSIGVATAGYQVEGGYNGVGEPANNWLNWERTGQVERSGVACDFWANPEAALDRAAAIGCNTFRLSVEWARLEPEAGQFDDEALARYGEILSLCTARGLEPVVTLHHFSYPWWLGEEFWLRPGSPDRFKAHVEAILPSLVPHAKKWVTLNEPNIQMLMGWIEGATPPGRTRAFADAYCVLDNLLTAHVFAFDAIKAVQPEAEITCNTSSSSIYEHDRLLNDLFLLRAAGVDESEVDRYIDERRALHNAVFPPEHAGELLLRRFFAALNPYGTAKSIGDGGLFQRIRTMARRPAPRRVLEAVYASPHESTLGAVGFDWYDPVASHALRVPGHAGIDGRRDWSVGRAIWDVPPHAEGLTSWCHAESVLHPDLALWVVENGMATKGGAPRADGWDRPRYLREHLGAIVRAIDDGIAVSGYLHWSLMDNYEWGTYEPRLGIFSTERDESGVHWSDTDAQGNDAAGAFSHIVRGLMAGDRSVLEGP